MNNLDIAKKEGRERFELDVKAHSIGKCSFSLPSICSVVEQDVKLFISEHERAIEIALLKDLVEEAEEIKQSEKGWPQCAGLGCHDDEPNMNAIIFNSALTTLITKYRDRIKKLEQQHEPRT